MHLQFSKALEKYATQKITAYVGYKPKRLLLELNYSKRLNIWWTFQKLEDKYWNSFGVGKPSEKHNNSITCEINYPLDGINTNLAGGIAKNEDGEVILLHNGRIGGGKPGIGKKLFIDNHIGGGTLEIMTGHILDYIPVGSLYSKRFPYHVALFVKEVSRIKNLNGKNIPLPQNLVNGEKIKTSFDDEFSGKKNITINHSGVAICDHGLVVNSLKELLEEKGAHIANDQLRDLYLFNNGEVEIVFEFKTGFDRQSVYSAIGQLLLNNTTLKPTPKYVMVLPLGLSEEIQSVVRNLNIELLQYEWISDGKVKFLNMEVLDCLR